MILYLDASALVKRYIQERGAAEVTDAIHVAEVVGTSVLSRAEVVAALAKAVRVGVLSEESAATARQAFQDDWPDLIRLQATEGVVGRAASEAWELGLRGYDAVHLASALVWQENVSAEVTFAAFDRTLWEAAAGRGLNVLPEDLPSLLALRKADTER